MTQSKDGNGHQEEYDPEVEFKYWMLMSGLRQMLRESRRCLYARCAGSFGRG
ncbi:hypothetical protein [Nostoc sp.]